MLNHVPSRTMCLVTAAAFVGGCAVGPDYKKPEVELPGSYRTLATTQPAGESASPSGTLIGDLPWWEMFKDDTLHGLITEALAKNHDLRAAIARVEQARAGETQARSEFFPQVGYGGSVSRGKNEFLGGSFPNGGQTFTSALVGLNAFWEVDLWGRIRRSDEAAIARILATDQGRRGVQLTLVTDVAQAYFELLELDAELEITQRTLNSYTSSYGVFDKQFQGGGGSKLSVDRASANVSTTAGIIPALQRAIAAKENQISILLARQPGPIPRPANPLADMTPPEVPGGLPSDLLQRRPDIVAAEKNLHAANATIGVRTADYFPRLGLTAAVGRVSPDVEHFTNLPTTLWSLGSTLSGPIFQGGRIKAGVRDARAKYDEALEQYRQTILQALRDVSDALIARQTLAQQRVEFDKSVVSLRDSVDNSNKLYSDGRATYFEILESQQLLYPAELQLARTRRDQMIAMVQVYRALGGGWNLDDAKWVSAEAEKKEAK